MLTASDQYRAALPFPHRRETRIEVWHAGALVADTDTGGLQFSGGTVTADLQSRVTRTLALNVPPGFFPETSDALLSPDIAELRVSSGIGYPDGSREIFPIFRGRVQQVQEDATGAITVDASDLAQDVVDAVFETPRSTVPGQTILQTAQQLVRDVLPDAQFGTSDIIDSLVPALTWDTDRGQALDDLTTAAGARWYFLGDGTPVVRLMPYTVGTPVATLADASGGVTMTATRTVSRTGVYNSVTVSSERTDGTDPVRVTVRNTDASSATRYGGPFGIKPEVIQVQTPLTSSEATTAGTQQLAASSALGVTWAINATPDYTLEPGDTIATQYRGHAAVQVIDSITYPLATADAQQIQGRASVPAPLVGVPQ